MRDAEMLLSGEMRIVCRACGCSGVCTTGVQFGEEAALPSDFAGVKAGPSQVVCSP